MRQCGTLSARVDCARTPLHIQDEWPRDAISSCRRKKVARLARACETAYCVSHYQSERFTYGFWMRVRAGFPWWG
jgi:hypothetical protein